MPQMWQGELTYLNFQLDLEVPPCMAHTLAGGQQFDDVEIRFFWEGQKGKRQMTVQTLFQACHASFFYTRLH